ncbi:hypothetical protein CR513_38712, partial [Mucuna pruriens]
MKSCDMVLMEATHIMLGWLWRMTRDEVFLKPLPPRKIYKDKNEEKIEEKKEFEKAKKAKKKESEQNKEKTRL